jgi:hypothetical protein
MAVKGSNPNVMEMYTVSNTTNNAIRKFEFKLESNNVQSVINFAQVDIINTQAGLAGFNSNVDSTITPEFLVVSVSNGNQPKVNFYSKKNLTIAKTYLYSGPFGNAKIRLSSHTNSMNITSIYIGANTLIDLVEFY